ncbi:unnamed protein product, partial [Adineta steineri]
ENHDKCIIGGACGNQVKVIGITLDDILRYEINQSMTLKNQPLLIKISIALTIIMFILGLINSILSFLTFQNENLRKVGCGIYLLASSITSLLTISMFTINFWFILLTQINLSVHRGGCISIEPLLKLFLYFDTWLNACVAIERAINVYQGVNFNKEKSQRFARWIIFILPFCISATIIHEPLHRNIFEHQLEDQIFGTKVIVEMHKWCVVNYSRVIQDYNTAILFIHLIGPFIANLFSALFIIFGTARQRSSAQTSQSYMEHIREQFREHKRLLISPSILLILSMPRLIISLLPGCVKFEPMNSNLSPTSINQPRWKYFQQRKLMWITILIIVIVLIIIIPIIIIKSKKPVVADVSTTGSRINIPSNARWKQNGITIAGGNYDGDALNQLESPRGLYVDDEQSVYIADTSNQRIMKWKNDAASGEVVAGGNEQGNRTDQLNQPTDVIVDKATDSFIICDRENRRVMTWSRRNSTTSGEIIIANIKCWRLTMDNQRFLYVTDTDKHE